MTLSHRTIGLILGIALPALMLLTGPPAGLAWPAWLTACLLVLMATWWATEAIPIPATSLLPLIVAPTLLTLMFVVLGATGALLAVPTLSAWLLPRPTAPGLVPLWWVGVGLLTASSVALAVFVAWVLGNIASSPFYDVLASRVETEELGVSDDDTSWSRVLSDAWMSVRHSIAGLGLYLVVQVGLLALHLVPVVGSVLNAVLGAAVTVAFVSREVMDIPLSRRRLSFGDKLIYLSDNRRVIGGHGAVVALLLLIPMANLLVTPLAVLGATLVFCDIEAQRGGLPVR